MTTSRSTIGGVRRGLKASVFTLSLIAVMPLIVLVWLEKRLTRTEAVFGLFGQLLAVVPGFPGRWLRGAYYYGTLDHCSWEIHIGFGSLFIHRGAQVGARASMGAYCVIGHATIGDGAMIGSRVSIPSGKHQHLDELGHLTSVARFECVSVGANAWIGEGAILLANVGRECIVSAGAVVISPASERSLVGGNPARVVKEIRGFAEN